MRAREVKRLRFVDDAHGHDASCFYRVIAGIDYALTLMQLLLGHRDDGRIYSESACRPAAADKKRRRASEMNMRAVYDSDGRE